MTAYEVFVNGEKVCLAGIEGDGVLNTMLDHVKSGTKRDEVLLRVGGFVSATGQHLVWTRLPLRVGDEIKVVVRNAQAVDEPREAVDEPEPRETG